MAKKAKPGKKGKILRRLVVGCLVIAVLLLGTILGILRFAPNLFSPLLVAELKKQGVEVSELTIRSIGTGQATLFLDGLAGGPVLARDVSLSLDYTFGTLRRARVNHAVISGVVLLVDLETGERDPIEPAEIPSIILKAWPSEPPLDSLVINDSRIQFHRANPLEPLGQIHLDAKLDAGGGFVIHGEEISLEGRLAPEQGQAEVNFTLKLDQPIQRLGPFVKKPDFLKDFASLSMQGHIQVTEQRFSQGDVSVQIGTLESKDAQLRDLVAELTLGKDLIPSQLAVNGTLGMLELEDFKAGPCKVEMKWTKDGNVAAKVGGTAFRHGDDIEGTLAKAFVSARLNKDHNPLQLSIDATLQKLEVADLRVDPWKVSLHWDEDGSLQATFGETGFKVKNGTKGQLKEASLKARLNKDFSASAWNLKGSLPQILLPRQELEVQDVTFSKEFDGEKVSGGLSSPFGTVGEIGFSELKINASLVQGALDLHGKLTCHKVVVPFSAESHAEALKPLLSMAGLAFNDDSIVFDQSAVTKALKFAAGPVELKENPILNILPSGLPEAAISGTFNLAGRLADQSFSVQARNAAVHFPEHEFSFTGLNTGLEVSLDGGLHTLRECVLEIANVKIGKLEMLDGRLPVDILQGNVLRTAGGAFKALDGLVRIGPTTLQLDGYDTIITGILHLEDVRLQELLNLAETPPLDLRGRFDGQIPFVFQQRDVQLQTGHLKMRTDTPGHLKYDAGGKFTHNLDPGTRRYKNMELAEKALLDLNLSEMELQLFPIDDTGERIPARALVKGSYTEKKRKINLDLTLNLRGEAEKVLRNAAKGKLDFSIGF